MELANKWFALWSGKKIFLYGRIIKSWYVYSLLKWIIISGMWGEICGTKISLLFCCDGFIMVPLWGCSLWKCRNLYIVENHVARVDTTASQSYSVDIVYNFNVWGIMRELGALMIYIKMLNWKYYLCLMTYIIKLLNIFLFELLL